MNIYTSYCGLNCETCEARLATVSNDNDLRKKVAAEWTKMAFVIAAHTPAQKNASMEISDFFIPDCSFILVSAKQTLIILKLTEQQD